MPKNKSVGGRKSVKIKKLAPKKAKPIYVSDDDMPDEAAESFYKDAIDLHNDQIDKDSDYEYMAGAMPEARAPRREPVYDFSDSDDGEEMEQRLRKIEANIRRRQMHESSGSEEEEVGDDEDVKARAWGKKREDFYGADVTTKIDVGVSSDDEQAEAIMEEQEAKLMQQKMAADITNSDCGLDLFDGVPDTIASSAATDLKLPSFFSKHSEVPQTVQVDFSKMSEKERARAFKRIHPEYLPIYTEFKKMTKELKEKLWPMLQLGACSVIPISPGLKVISDKCQLMELFVECALIFFLLVAEREATKGHPVFERMLSLQKLIKKYDEIETETFKAQIEKALQMMAEGREQEVMEEVGTSFQNSSMAVDNETSVRHKKTKKERKSNETRVSNEAYNENLVETTIVSGMSKSSSTQPVSEKSLAAPENVTAQALEPIQKKKKNKGTAVKKRMQDLLDVGEDHEPVEEEKTLTAGEKEALEYYSLMRKRQRAGEENELEENEGEVDMIEPSHTDGTLETIGDKRAITEEMQKNRGLTAKRPKHLKNPRVKNKLKFQRKKKIYKTMVPQVLTEMNRYCGEVGGIRAGRVRSVALS